MSESDDSLLRRDEMLYFEGTRFTCAEISPHIVRSRENFGDEKMRRKFTLMRDLLSNAGSKEIEKTMTHIVAFDRSEEIKPVGSVSQSIYKSILDTRGFDLYGRLRTKAVVEKMREFRMEEGVEELEPIHLFDPSEPLSPPPKLSAAIKRNMKKLALTTPKWRIGESEEYNAPVGFAKNPTRECRSLGNESHFSYDGSWEKGLMSGLGTYVYSDNLRYDGNFKLNRPEGVGTATYEDNQSSYEGEWSSGKFSGIGVMRSIGGGIYRGRLMNGRREGEGRLEYGQGLVYEGEFSNGKPDGRGVMTSELTGYVFEGTFKEGKACGSGVLITPPPHSVRIVRMWGRDEHFLKREDSLDNNDNGSFLLPDIIKLYLAESKDAADVERKRKQATFGPLQVLKLDEYVVKCREKIQREKASIEKEEARINYKRQSDLRNEIKNTRMKAVGEYFERERAKENHIAEAASIPIPATKIGSDSGRSSAGDDSADDSDDDR